MARNQTRTKTRGVVLVDDVRQSPVDRDLAKTTRRLLFALLLVVALVVALVYWRAAASRDQSVALGFAPGSSSTSAESGGMPVGSAG